MKSKATAILLAFFLGGIGGHKFYLGQTGMGVLYLLFCWTFIPSLVALFEFIGLILMSEEDFNRKFNGVAVVEGQKESVKDSAAALGELKKLYDSGVITAEEYEEKRRKLLDSI